MLDIKASSTGDVVNTKVKIAGQTPEIAHEIATVIALVATHFSPAKGSTYADVIHEMAENAIQALPYATKSDSGDQT